MSFIFKKLSIPDIILVEPKVFSDERGFFMRVLDDNLFNQFGFNYKWVQENHSSNTRKGIVRGLHFQFPPYTETKLVRAIKGEIFDVFVDLRIGSSTFGEWGSVVLSDKKYNCILIPRGFAHGFYVLSEKAAINYKCNNFYSVEHERTLHWQDPELNIQWPLYKNIPVIISEKDNAAGFLNT